MNNIPAFPVFPETGSGHASAFQGMTLRDYFAAKAMQGYLACKAWHPEFVQSFDQEFAETGKTKDVLSKVCYLMADAMMKAREA